MNAVEIEEAISALAEQPFNAEEFPFAFLEAFGNKATTIKRLRSGASNKSDLDGVLQTNNIHLQVCAEGEVTNALSELKASPATAKAKAKFVLATDGKDLEAEDLSSGETIACAYADFPDHFGFFLPLAGISTVKQIRESAFDIKATGRLNRLYVELLKDNPEWGTAARRHDMNHFMARLIFCFFAEDTDIFTETDQFTATIERMSAKDSSNTHEVISELFRAMNTKGEDRAAANIARWANVFPYVNGGLFSGSTDRGLGVHTALETDKDLSIAFKAASEHGKVILQEHIPGDDFRILVVDGAVIGVTQRKPFAIIGNGQMSIQDLIIEKLKWRASHSFYRNFNRISPDSQDIKFTLQKQGLSFDDVLNEGRTLVLRSNANVSAGGEHLDVTEKCHDDVKRLALDCAELFGLDVAGIDYLSANISASWKNGNGVVCEVNPTPAMSVDGMPEKVFERFGSLARPSALNQDVGDIIYIKDCACKFIPDIMIKFGNFNFIDLRKINEKQYFFQSFLTARSGRYFCIINTQMLDRYGLVNSNVREIILCANCASQSGSLQNLPNTPYDFNITYL